MNRDDYKSSGKNGAAYLHRLDAIVAEHDFQKALVAFVADFKGDPSRATVAALALKGGKEAESALLMSAECILQERIRPKVHTR